MPKKLIWFDCETTGLNCNKHVILEVCAMEANFMDPFNAKVIHQSVLFCHPDTVHSLDPFIIDMHTKNGLFKECAHEEKALDAFEVQEALLQCIPEEASKDDMPVLAGSSIHFDRGFINEWMPKFDKRLSHRHYDVSALKLFCESLGMPKFPKALAHRAMEDVLESIDHAKRCEAWLRARK